MDRDLKCEICNNPYDLENRSPICIPCGHTLCLICLKENYEREGKVKCSNDNKAFNLRPDQYAKNHYILKLLQSKKTVITNININKNINLVNNNNISLNTNGSTINTNNNKININSHRSEHVNNISFLRDEKRINSFNCTNSGNNGSSNNGNFSNGSVKRGNNLNFNLKTQNSNEVRVFPKNKIPEYPNESVRTLKRNNYLLKTQSIINKQENEIENIKKIGHPRLDSSRSINYKNPSTEEKELDENNEESQMNNEKNLEPNTEKTDSARDSKRIIVKKVRKIAKKSPLITFEEHKLLVFKNTRFHINSNFKNNYPTNNANGNCRKCGSCNENEIHFNYNNYLNSENNLSIAYSDLSKNENREINQELHSLKNFLNKNLGEEIITKDKIGFRNNSETRVNELKTSRKLSNENLKDSLIKNISEIENIKKLLRESKNQAKLEKDPNNQSFVLIPDGEEDSININESDIICINPNNYSSNVFFENINAPVDKNKISKASDKLFGIGSSINILDEYPNLKNIEKSELKKITKLSKRKISDQFKNYEIKENSIKNDTNKNSTNKNSNPDTNQFQKLNFHSNILEENNAFNKLFPTITEKDDHRINTHRNSDSRQFNTSYLSNENFNFNLIESTTSKDLKKFESRVKNNDSPPIIFGYFNILKNFLIKVNKIDILDFYPNLDFLFAEIIIGINIVFKTLAVLLLILFNLFLFKCDFFLRFNMYLILINDTKSVIEKGEIGLIIANIKRWFAFISVVILDELIKFLYLPDLVLHAWTCLMTIYLLLISGPESGVQFIIVSIYEFLRKFNLFY